MKHVNFSGIPTTLIDVMSLKLNTFFILRVFIAIESKSTPKDKRPRNNMQYWLIKKSKKHFTNELFIPSVVSNLRRKF